MREKEGGVIGRGSKRGGGREEVERKMEGGRERGEKRRETRDSGMRGKRFWRL